jgi:RNA polymerase sigma-70 factor (ECF subfamily)
MMDEREDAELIKSIALKRDRGAFEELYRRYSEPAFNVAFHITGNRTVAEEAVQEGLLSIWLSAQNFEPGNARGWILQVVARKGIRMALGNRTEKRRMKSQSERLQNSEAGAADVMERTELLAALRNTLAELPELERQVVAMYFGAGLSQQEIGAALSIPQQTISVRINKAIENMRGSLARTGFAAALPLIGAEGLSDALSAGQSVPPGLREKVLSGMAKAAARQSVRILPRVAGAKAAGVIAAALTFSIAAIGIVALWGPLKTPPPAPAVQTAAEQTPAVQAPVVQAPVAPALTVPTDIQDNLKKEETIQIGHWSFEDGPADDLKVISKNWVWQKGDGNLPGRMESSDGAPVYVLIPIRMPKNRAIKVTAELISGSAKMQCFAMWVKNQTVMPSKQWDLGFGVLKASAPIEASMVFNGKYCEQYYRKNLTSVTCYESDFPGDHLIMKFDNLPLRELKIERLSSADLKREFKDPEATIARFLKRGVQETVVDSRDLPTP